MIFSANFLHPFFFYIIYISFTFISVLTVASLVAGEGLATNVNIRKLDTNAEARLILLTDSCVS